MKRALPLLLPMALLLLGAGDPATETEHVVGDGETLSGIASRAGVDKAVIAAANGLTEPYDVRKGQKLFIPRQRSHTVAKGETGFAIAMKYGVPYSQIAIANGLDDKGTVKIGQKLIIPAVMPETMAVAFAPVPEQPYFRRPHDGKVTLGWAVRGDGKGHDGLDFAARPGDMVRAAASGVVSGIARHDPRFGNLVTVDHGNGWKSAYGHLAKITVKMGDVVKTGERVGLAGHSGDAKTTELHFEIRHDGKKVDPAPLLPARKGD
ncbi:MAG: M23 family metallopeptidase [Sphingomonadales bacterium]|nr:M23 family metallopeptidase [Sphingomonadales bacterium]MBD3774013.1 M23 family metallopeptidase [Paracoccaceae bacterium]